MEGRISEHTRIEFVTTGVLLQRLVNNRAALEKVTHVILDEVHERDSFTDFTMTVMKKVLKSSPQLKLILMSATFSTRLFARYFSPTEVANFNTLGYDYSEEEVQQAPSRWGRKEKESGPSRFMHDSDEVFSNIIEINHRAYPVHKFYLCSLYQFLGIRGPISPLKRPGVVPELADAAIRMIIQRIHLEGGFAEFETTGHYRGWLPPSQEPDQPPSETVSLAGGKRGADMKSVLVFLPGMGEIDAFCQ